MLMYQSRRRCGGPVTAEMLVCLIQVTRTKDIAEKYKQNRREGIMPRLSSSKLLAHAYEALYGLAIGITMWFSSDASRAPSVLLRTSWPSILPQSVSTIMPVIWYGSALEAGLRSSK